MNDQLKVAHINIRSLVPKFFDLSNYVLESDFDIFTISETWLNSDISNDALKIDRYNLVRKDRKGRGGGVCMFIKNIFKYNVIKTNDSIEQLWLSVSLKKLKLAIAVVYRSPSLSYKTFTDEFEQSCTYCLSICDHLLCLGDMNIDMSRRNNLDSIYFNNLLETLDLHQTIEVPTRLADNTTTLIDLIITSDKNLVTQSGTYTLNLSDHELIFCYICYKKVISPTIFRTIRCFKNFDQNMFYQELLQLPLQYLMQINDVNDKIAFLNEQLLCLFDKHAPVKTIKITNKKTPWITDNVRLMMKLRDKAKAQYLKNKTNGKWEYYKSLRNLTTRAIKSEKKSLFSI